KLPDDAQINGADISPRQRAFAAGNDSYGAKEGRVLILADHSLFSNALLWQRQGDAENHNFEFAEACASWLTESGKRKQVLFIEHGDIVDNFYTKFIEEPAPPMPPIEDVVHAINQGLYGVQEENRFNDWIAGLADEVRPRNTIVILTVLLTAYGLLRLGQAKQHVDPNVPLLGTGLVQIVPSVGLVSQ